MISICLYLDAFLIPIRYIDNINYLINQLNNKYNLTIYCPKMISLKYKYNYKFDIISLLKLYNHIVITTPIFSFNRFDILIMFSDYDRNICFDRRIQIINSIKHNLLLIIPSFNYKIYNVPIKNNNNYNIKCIVDNVLINQINDYDTILASSIFDLPIKYDIDYFKFKYSINKPVIAFIPGKNYTLPNLHTNEYNILGIKHYNDYSAKEKSITWIHDIDYNVLKQICIAIIVINNEDINRYTILKKPIINLSNVTCQHMNFIKCIIKKKTLFNNNYISNINIIDIIDDIINEHPNYIKIL